MSILTPFVLAWARLVGFTQQGSVWVRGSERVAWDELVKRYQASIR